MLLQVVQQLVVLLKVLLVQVVVLQLRISSRALNACQPVTEFGILLCFFFGYEILRRVHRAILPLETISFPQIYRSR